MDTGLFFGFAYLIPGLWFLFLWLYGLFPGTTKNTVGTLAGTHTRKMYGHDPDIPLSGSPITNIPTPSTKKTTKSKEADIIHGNTSPERSPLCIFGAFPGVPISKITPEPGS